MTCSRLNEHGWTETLFITVSKLAQVPPSDDTEPLPQEKAARACKLISDSLGLRMYDALPPHLCTFLLQCLDTGTALSFTFTFAECGSMRK
jgi:hypothetical protein